jgi:hypothetical protein
MKKSYFIVEIESEHEILADTLEQNIYSRFLTSVESVKVEAIKQEFAFAHRLFQECNCGSVAGVHCDWCQCYNTAGK